ncbi:MAG: M24 family metallopeptidase [Candidatus Acidiferrales bacterium]
MTEESIHQSKSRSRIDRLRLLLSKAGADSLLVFHLPNIQYLCGFSGSAGLLLVEPSRVTLFTDSRYTFQAIEEVADSGVKVNIAKGGLLKAAGQSLKKCRRRIRVAYAPPHVTVAQKRALDAAAGGSVRWVDAPGLVERLRSIKDGSELALMANAARLISEVFHFVLPRIALGITELSLAAEIEYAMKQRGASGPSFESIVASGPRSAWAHARPSSKAIGKNELVVLDQGAILHGYCSDMTRTVFVGRAPDKVRRMYGAVAEAQEAAKTAIRPGVSAAAIDRAARQVLKKHGLARFFTHSTGHGLGIEVHEVPRLGRDDRAVLEEGMVVTVEPGVYIEGVGGIRIEDEVVVTARGAVNLTKAAREFLEL